MRGCSDDGSSPARHQEHGIGDWDLAFAYEAIARAYKVAGEAPEAKAYVKLAREVPISDAEDREHLEESLATI